MILNTPTFIAFLNPAWLHILPTGIPGLDHVLGGGLTKERLYLLEGDPGTGKTIMAHQFLIEGAKQGETVHEVIQEKGLLDPAEHYTALHPSEVELGETNKLILEMIEKIRATRVVLDSLSELQRLSGNALQCRRHVLGLKQYFAKRSLCRSTCICISS